LYIAWRFRNLSKGEWLNSNGTQSGQKYFAEGAMIAIFPRTLSHTIASTEANSSHSRPFGTQLHRLW
jgi:hypothetical protein